MSKFEEFIKENNYEGDLEYQLCDLELAFDEGMRIGKSQSTWKPSEEQLVALRIAIGDEQGSDCCDILRSLLKDLKSL